MLRLYLLLLYFLSPCSLEKMFLIPHSHQDLGCVNTIDGYYSKWVKKILNGVLDALEKTGFDNKRKYTSGDLGFLKIYLNDPADNNRMQKIERIKKLID